MQSLQQQLPDLLGRECVRDVHVPAPPERQHLLRDLPAANLRELFIHLHTVPKQLFDVPHLHVLPDLPVQHLPFCHNVRVPLPRRHLHKHHQLFSLSHWLYHMREFNTVHQMQYWVLHGESAVCGEL